MKSQLIYKEPVMSSKKEREEELKEALKRQRAKARGASHAN